ncbi:hypothetical protein Tco_1303531 [Tanacetum coccineum]
MYSERGLPYAMTEKTLELLARLEVMPLCQRERVISPCKQLINARLSLRNLSPRIKGMELMLIGYASRALTGANIGSEVGSLRVDLNYRRLDLPVFRRVPEPEVEAVLAVSAVLEITKMEACPLNWPFDFARSLVSWWLINLGSVNLALVEIVPSVLIVIVSPIEIVFDYFLDGSFEREGKTGMSSNLILPTSEGRW